MRSRVATQSKKSAAWGFSPLSACTAEAVAFEAAVTAESDVVFMMCTRAPVGISAAQLTDPSGVTAKGTRRRWPFPVSIPRML
jgi:hypothetical protein